MFVVHNYTPNNVCIIIEAELIHKWLFAGARYLTQAVTQCFELPPCSEWAWQLQSSVTTEVRKITAAEEKIKHFKKILLSSLPQILINSKDTTFLIKKRINILGIQVPFHTCPFNILDTPTASLQWLYSSYPFYVI